MMAAAKERISWSEGPGVALPLAAAVPVAKNSRPGFELKKINSRPGWSEVNFKTVSGIGVSLRQNGIGSRCQSLNRYAYVLNNPTSLVDPSGLCTQGQPNCPPSGIKPSCTNMDCVFTTYKNTICYIGGLMGPCPSGMNNFSFNLGTEINQVDIFDANKGAPGTYIIPGGQIQCDASGRCSTGTGSFGFSDQLWSQTWGFIDAARGQGFPNLATSGYQVYQLWNGTQSAAFSSVAEAESAGQTGFINSLNGRLDAMKLANPVGPYALCATLVCSVQVTPQLADGSGNLTIGVTAATPAMPALGVPASRVPLGPSQTWPFP